MKDYTPKACFFILLFILISLIVIPFPKIFPYAKEWF